MSERIVAVVVTVVCGGLLWLQVKHGVKLDSITVALVGLALLPWLLPYAKQVKISPSGIEYQRIEAVAQRAIETAQLAKENADVARGAAVDGIGKKPGPILGAAQWLGSPGSQGAMGLTADLPEGALAEAVGALSSDPHHGRFGGRADVDGWTLSATVKSLPRSSDLFEVCLKVTDRNGSRPRASQEVKFHLHPTFTPPEKVVPVRNGVATLVRYAWGAFTVGAEVLPDGPRLELDLAELQDAPELFRSR